MIGVVSLFLMLDTIIVIGWLAWCLLTDDEPSNNEE